MPDIYELRSTYGERAGTLVFNADVMQIFNVADIDTATCVSQSPGVGQSGVLHRPRQQLV